MQNGVQPSLAGPGPNHSWTWKQHNSSQMRRIALSDFQFRQLVLVHVEPKLTEGNGFEVESKSRGDSSLLIEVETSHLSWALPNREAVRIR